MYEWKMKLPAYLDGKKGVDKYSAYNSGALMQQIPLLLI